MASTGSTSSIGTGVALLEVEQAAQGAVLLALLVDQRGVFLEGLVVVGAHGLLQLVDRLRVEEVGFAVVAPLVVAADVERVAVDLAVREGVLMPRIGLRWR